jgi:hypothetical protein
VSTDTGATTGRVTPAADADAIATAVLACPSVAGLGGGPAGAVATYLPGRRVTGVRMRPDGRVVVHVVGHYGPTVAQIAAEVTAAVREVAGPVDVRVGIDDLLLPARPALPTPPPAAR